MLFKKLYLSFRFFTADKAVGAKGFKAVWTEIKEGPGKFFFGI